MINKKIMYSAFSGVTLFLSLSTSALASVESDLENYFSQNISNFDQKLCSLNADIASTSPLFTLADINVQVSASATFGISSVLALTISPEIDFIVTPAVSP